jgi:[ribosomal protein S18]-alanine N-acetyltransferase
MRSAAHLAVLKLRDFRASDLDALYCLDQACFPPNVAYSLAELVGFIRCVDARTWVAEAGAEAQSEIAGFVVARCDLRREGHIITLDVAPAWRRRAVGTMLMDAAENWIRQQGGKAVYLETAEENFVAQAFYLRRGYVKLRRIAGYYANGAAAWLMAKELWVMNDDE